MIRLVANVILSYEMIKSSRIPADVQLEAARRELSEKLAHSILNKKEIFSEEWKEPEHHITPPELVVHAECYVFTPSEYAELVEKIRSETFYGQPVSILGGVFDD